MPGQLPRPPKGRGFPVRTRHCFHNDPRTRPRGQVSLRGAPSLAEQPEPPAPRVRRPIRRRRRSTRSPEPPAPRVWRPFGNRTPLAERTGRALGLRGPCAPVELGCALRVRGPVLLLNWGAARLVRPPGRGPSENAPPGGERPVCLVGPCASSARVPRRPVCLVGPYASSARVPHRGSGGVG